MTTSRERINYKVSLDARQANAGMDQLRNKAQTTSATISGGAKNFQGNIEKAATAVTGMSSVLGGLGSKAGATFGAVSNLASAFLTGGPLLGGLALATTAAAAFIAVLREEEEAARQAEAAINGALSGALARTKKDFDDAKSAADNARKALQNFGKTSLQVAIDSAKAAKASAVSRIGNLQNDIADRERQNAENQLRARRIFFDEELNPKNEGAERDAFLENLRINKQVLKLDKERVPQLEAAVAQRNDEIKALEELQRKTKAAAFAAKARVTARKINDAEEKIARSLRDARAKRSFERAQEAGQAEVQAYDFLFQSRAELIELGLQREREAAEKSKEIAEKRAKAEADAAQKAKDAELAALQQRQQNLQQFANVAASLTQGTLAIGFSAIEDLVAGEEKALERALLGFTRMVGGQLIGIGIRGITEGAVNSANPLAPGSGAGQIATGSAALAAGVALGGGSAIAAGALRRQANSSTFGGGSDRLRNGSFDGRRGFSGGGQGDQAETVSFTFVGSTVIDDPATAARRINTIQRRGARRQLRANP